MITKLAALIKKAGILSCPMALFTLKDFREAMISERLDASKNLLDEFRFLTKLINFLLFWHGTSFAKFSPIEQKNIEVFS